MARRTRDRAGFTMIEIMAVLVVLMILVGIVVGVGKYIYDDALKKQSSATLVVLRDAVQAAYTVSGSYPASSTTNTLTALRSVGGDVPECLAKLSGDAIKNGVIVDAWGRCIRYVNNGDGTFYVSSDGPDGTNGTADDIRSDRQ